jgi:predicted flap endonuclease-1-like 5' DNA nuclease
MSDSFASALPLILIGLVFLVIAIMLFMRANRKTKVVGAEDREQGEIPGDEEAAKPRRNEALINSPRAVEKTIGDTSATANAHGIATAGESADAEAGVRVAPTVGDPVPEPGEQAAPAAAPAPAPAPGDSDDLSRIKGVGPKLVTLLHELGVTRFDQIAAWDEAEIDRVDSQLGRFKGRIRRDQWVEQAKLLSSGDKDGFEAKFGRGA